MVLRRGCDVSFLLLQRSRNIGHIQWIKVNVDARSREVFSYEVQIVPGNRVAVPAP